jgi:hypothetical protein
VKVTCPKCGNFFSFDTHLGMTAPPLPAPGLPEKASAGPEVGLAGDTVPGHPVAPQVARADHGANSDSSAASAADEAAGYPDIPQKYREFVDDYNSGLDRASLCRKYDIPDQKFSTYLEFLKRKGLHLAEPVQPPPDPAAPSSGNPEPSAGKDVPSRKKSGLFEPIESREGALKMVRDGAKAFYILAGIQVLIGLFLMREIISDGIAFAILAFFLQKFSSRVAAILLLLISGLSLVVTLLNLAGVTSQGGRNIWLAVIVVIVSARMVEATFRLHGEYRNAAATS